MTPTTDAGDVKADFLREQAERYRHFAREIVDERAQRVLIEMAEEYEARAAEARGKQARDCKDRQQ